MLVLSRKVGERILIGDDIRITVVRVSGGGVRIGVEAPAEKAVIREELKAQLEQAAAEQARLEKTKAQQPQLQRAKVERSEFKANVQRS